MMSTLKRIGACVCVAAFLLGAAGSAVLGFPAGPRNPGADVYLETVDIKLRVGGIEVPEGIVGDQVAINLTIRNIGDQDSAKVNVLILYDDSNTFINTSNLTVPVPSSGGSVSYEAIWDTTNVAIGDHYINVTLTELLSGDMNLTNNTAKKPFTVKAVPKAHVYVDSIDIKDSALVGQNVTIKANLKNDGTKASDLGDSVKFMVGTQLLPGGNIVYSGPLADDNTTIAPVEYNWDTQNFQAGQFIIKVEVVSSGFKAESRPITLSFPMPNVYVYKLDVDKDTILQGDSILVSGKLRNNGTKTAVDEEVWFLVDKATSPTLANYTQTKNIPMNDQDVNFQFSWNSTDAAAGHHNFTVRVPGSSDPKAQATTKNVLVTPRLPRVNLTGFEVKPPTVKSGETITLAAKLENTGSADAYNQEVRFFLGSVETYPISIKKVNVRVGTASWANATYIAEIGENDTTMNFFAVFIAEPNETLTGSAKIISTVPQRPDLVVANVEVVRNMLVNNEYYVTAVVSNNGKAPALNFTVKFNLGTELPYLVRGLDLANGQSLTVNWSVRPTQIGQNLRLKVEVNAEHSPSAVESDEFNNIFESIQDIMVRAQPKASINLESAEPDAKSYKVHAGDKGTVKISVKLKNSGEKDGTVMVTIKEGLVVVLSENVTVPANETRTVTYKWNITSPGTHTAKVVIEGADAGLISSRITSVDLTEWREWYEPGFELLVVLAVVGFFVILAGRRRR